MRTSSVASVHARRRGRWTLIVAGVFALLGSFAVTAPAQAGYYPCYGCGPPPVYAYPHRCYSCGPHLIYERRYVEREFVERRYGYGGYHRPYGYYGYGYRRPYGCDACGYHRPYGYYGYGGYRRPYGYYPYGYGGVRRRWPVPFFGAYGAGYGGGYEPAPYDDESAPEGYED